MFRQFDIKSLTKISFEYFKRITILFKVSFPILLNFSRVNNFELGFPCHSPKTLAFFSLLMQSLSLKFGLCVGIYQRIATAYGFYRLSTWPNDHPKCKRHWSARDSILVDWLHSKIPTSLICIATWYPICSEGTVGEIAAAFSCVSGKWPKVISHACNKKNKMHVL